MVTNQPPQVKNSMNIIAFSRSFMEWFSTSGCLSRKTRAWRAGADAASHAIAWRAGYCNAISLSKTLECLFRRRGNSCGWRDLAPDAAGGMTREHRFDQQVAAIAVGERRERGRSCLRPRPVSYPLVRVRDHIAEGVRPAFLVPGRQVRVACGVARIGWKGPCRSHCSAGRIGRPRARSVVPAATAPKPCGHRPRVAGRSCDRAAPARWRRNPWLRRGTAVTQSRDPRS